MVTSLCITKACTVVETITKSRNVHELEFCMFPQVYDGMGARFGLNPIAGKGIVIVGSHSASNNYTHHQDPQTGLLPKQVPHFDW